MCDAPSKRSPRGPSKRSVVRSFSCSLLALRCLIFPYALDESSFPPFKAYCSLVGYCRVLVGYVVAKSSSLKDRVSIPGGRKNFPVITFSDEREARVLWKIARFRGNRELSRKFPDAGGGHRGKTTRKTSFRERYSAPRLVTWFFRSRVLSFLLRSRVLSLLLARAHRQHGILNFVLKPIHTFGSTGI